MSTTIGYSVQGRPINTYRLGNGLRHIVLVGGMHGGYEWNSILLAYEIMDYLAANPGVIPSEITVHVIPSANPDGQYLVTQQAGRFTAADVISDTVPGRFNANDVDLNRNWDCQWLPSAVWRDIPVSGGEAPFSEPENVALRDYLLTYTPEVVIFLHSAANGVFASGCPDPHRPSLELATVYGEAAGYPIYERFNAYPITGDAGDWLTTQDIPSFTVELRNHSVTDWPDNRAGIVALLTYVAGRAESG
jgi:predicted deacylase